MPQDVSDCVRGVSDWALQATPSAGSVVVPTDWLASPSIYVPAPREGRTTTSVVALADEVLWT